MVIATRKGQEEWFTYNGTDEEAKIIGQTVFGADFNPLTSFLTVNDAVDKLMAITIHSQPLDVQSLKSNSNIFLREGDSIGEHFSGPVCDPCSG